MRTDPAREAFFENFQIFCDLSCPNVVYWGEDLKIAKEKEASAYVMDDSKDILKDDEIIDCHIVELYTARDEAAIEKTQQRYGTYCRAIARRILGNDADADECVNDTYLQLWQSIPPHAPKNLAAYLGKLVRNLCINRLRQQHRQKRGGGQLTAALDELAECIPDPAQDATRWADAMTLRQSVTTFLATLPEQTRRVFLQRYFYMCPLSEIAREMDMGESRVKMLLLRTREKLREHLQKEGLM